MADFATKRLIYSPLEQINTDTTVIFGGDYYITTESVITLQNINMVDGGSIRFNKKQGVSPTIKTLNGSGHSIKVNNSLTDTEIIYDIESEIILFWNDTDLVWEV